MRNLVLRYSNFFLSVKKVFFLSVFSAPVFLGLIIGAAGTEGLLAGRHDQNAERGGEQDKESFAQKAGSQFRAVQCRGKYRGHLQGVCTNNRDAIFWSFTVKLVKTDTAGCILKQIDVADHHGDLCFHKGNLYVAVNLGKFNQPAGQADSWVYSYGAETLGPLDRFKVPQLVHGAGGIAYHDGRFLVVGGLPENINENYLYEYDESFTFQKRHVLPSGHTHLGIQTAAFANGQWWFGCYGSPRYLLKADPSFKLLGKYKFDCALGVVGLPEGGFLIGRGSKKKSLKWYMGSVVVAVVDPNAGLVVRPAR
jgi:hypothetical protein